MADDRNGYIALEGVEQVSRILGEVDERVKEAAMQGLEAAALNIIADAC